MPSRGRSKYSSTAELLSKALFVTGNLNKLNEVRAILGPVKHLEIDLPEIQELDPRKVVLAKARSALEHGYSPILIEDTSMYLTDMNGLPGPLIKWFLKALGAEGVYQMALSRGDLTSQVKTIFGLAVGPQTILYGEGVVEGTVVSPRGSGFGWDSIFQPNGFTKTFGEMTAEEKNSCSMRARALVDLHRQVDVFLGRTTSGK